VPEIQIVHKFGRIQNIFLSEEETFIGRDSDNNIVIDDEGVSRRHAKIEQKKDHYYLVDLGSWNGTIVNGKKRKKVRLKDKDLIIIGRSRLLFKAGEKPETSPSEILELSPEIEEDQQPLQIVKSSEVNGYVVATQTLLVPSPSLEIPKPDRRYGDTERMDSSSSMTEVLHSLKRTNGVLFVLYEISRQMNTIHDFKELLEKIMDLVFQVVDADYGFVVLTDKKKDDDLSPAVVKFRDESLSKKEQIRPSRTIINRILKDRVALLTSDVISDPRLGPTESLLEQEVRSAICVPLWKKDEIIGVIQLHSVRPDRPFTEDDLELLKTIGCQMAMVIEQANLNEKLREEEQLINCLERFHSPQVIDMILRSSKKEQDRFMEPKDLTATILFSDITGFSTFAERITPREVNRILNQYFSRMTDIIFEYGGTLDKYLGDGLMAIFGAPIEREDDAERAIQAAKKIRDEVKIMFKRGESDAELCMRFGINTGRVVAGQLGSLKRMDYTVIGDAVNTASRLQSITEPNKIYISEETFKLVKNKFKVNKLGPQKLKGKRKEITVFEVL